ncbi:MAG: LamG domain-containing protein [Isosphaeraceae bacterium]
MYRFPSPSDLALNVARAITGLLVSRRLRIPMLAIKANVWTAGLWVLAAIAVLGCVVIILLNGPSDGNLLSVNCRGSTVPGTMEAHWTVDQITDGVSADSSGNGLHGTLKGGATLAGGIHGNALRLDGKKDYVDLGNPVELQLMGSVTISAWINSTSFPRDDAVIVSNSPSYQLDTTVDSEPRTIGFKLDGPCGNFMARFGATALVPDTWYHVAGVYDADKRTLDVYLNGHLDNGSLTGPGDRVHGPSSYPVRVGQRADLRGFEFAGFIDDVRIDSRALTQMEIEKAMIGVEIGNHPAGKTAYTLACEILEKRPPDRVRHCHQSTRDEDSIVPGLMIAVGVLTALACAGFWPGHRLPILIANLTAGLLVVPTTATTLLPLYFVCMLPLLSLAGGASVAISVGSASQSTS